MASSQLRKPPKGSETTTTEATGSFEHGEDCPHCKIRETLMALISERHPAPAWDLIVFCLTLTLAEFIAANPSAEQRLNACVYVRRELPQIVGEEERDYAANDTEGYQISKPQGRA